MKEIGDWIAAQWGSLVGVLGVLVAVVTYWWSRRPKQFAWQVSTLSPILTNWGSELQHLKVVYLDREVSHPNMIILRLGNLGKAEIRASDFDGPVRVEVAGRLLAANVLQGSHTVPSLVVEENTVNFTPTLLNAREWLELRLITDGEAIAPTVKARVAGQNSEAFDNEKRRAKMNTVTGKIAWIMILGFFIAALVSKNGVISAVGIIVAIVCSVVMVFVSWRLSNKTVWAKRAEG